jgi:hypothetical protein
VPLHQSIDHLRSERLQQWGNNCFDIEYKGIVVTMAPSKGFGYLNVKGHVASYTAMLKLEKEAAQ